jgi:hypothetical protein
MYKSSRINKFSAAVVISAVFPISLERTAQMSQFALPLRNCDESHLRLVKVGEIRTIKDK